MLPLLWSLMVIGASFFMESVLGSGGGGGGLLLLIFASLLLGLGFWRRAWLLPRLQWFPGIAQLLRRLSLAEAAQLLAQGEPAPWALISKTAPDPELRMEAARMIRDLQQREAAQLSAPLGLALRLGALCEDHRPRLEALAKKLELEALRSLSWSLRLLAWVLALWVLSQAADLLTQMPMGGPGGLEGMQGGAELQELMKELEF